MSGAPAVEVEGLVKRYRRTGFNAVDGVSFEVGAGEVFGLLGPNGAGKTTTVGVLTTRVAPSAGCARLGGIDVVDQPVEARRQLAVVPQHNNLDRALSIRDNLIFHAAYHGVPKRARRRRAKELLAQFDLLERANQRPEMFSGGQSQRVMIARALMHEPIVLFLDEPTSGLDPTARRFVWDRMRELKDRGVTLVLTTHDMQEAAVLADRVGIMDYGRLLVIDTPQNLMRSLPGRSTLDAAIEGVVTARITGAFEELPGVHRVEVLRDDASGLSRVRLYLSGDPAMLVAPIAMLLATNGLSISDVKLGEPSLEDVFIELTGRTLA